MQSNIIESENEALQTSPCELCDRDDRTRIVRCLNCDLEAVTPLPDKNNLKSIYDLEMKVDPSKTSKNDTLFKIYITQHIEREKSFKKFIKNDYV